MSSRLPKNQGQTTLPPMGNAENVGLPARGRAVCPVFPQPAGFRVFVVAVILLLPAAALVWLVRDMPYFGLPYDDGMYFSSAKALAENGTYRLPYLPVPTPDTNHPPLYSAYLSLVWLLDPVFPRNLSVAIWFAWLPLPLLVWVSSAFWREHAFSTTERLVLLAAVAVNFAVLLASVTLMSDLLFTVLLLAGVLALRKTGLMGAAMAGLCLGAAALTRTAVLPFAAAAVIYCALRREWWRAVVLCAVFAPFPAAWAWWAARQPPIPGEAVYALQWPPVAVLQQLWYTLASTGNLVMPGSANWFRGVTAPVFGVAALAGAWRLVGAKRGIRDWPVLHLAAVPYLMLLVLWRWAPSPANPRWLLPLYPLLLAGFYVEARHFVRMVLDHYRRKRGAERVLAATFAGLAAVAGVAFVYGNVTGYNILLRSFSEERRALASERAAYDWMRSNLPAGSVVLTRNAAALYLHTGLRAVVLPSDFALLGNTPPAGGNMVRDWLARMRSAGARYLYLPASTFDQSGTIGALAETFERGAGLRRVYQSNAAVVLERLGEEP